MSRLKFQRTLVVFFFVLRLIAARAQAPPQTSLPGLQSVDALGPELFLQSGSTGMVLVVVRDNQVFFRGYGETAPNSLQTPTQDSLLRLCSLTT
jgi:serine-type D-Ala-D-Ala carboxypeptidase/endopeptidase